MKKRYIAIILFSLLLDVSTQGNTSSKTNSLVFEDLSQARSSMLQLDIEPQLLGILRQAESFTKNVEKFEKLKHEQKLVAYLSQYTILWLEEKPGDAHKALSTAFHLNSNLPNYYISGRFYFLLFYIDRLDTYRDEIIDGLNTGRVLLAQKERVASFWDNRYQNQKVELSPEWLILKISEYLGPILNQQEEIRLGRLVDDFTQLQNRIISEYSTSQLSSTEKLFDAAERINILLLLERVFTLTHEIILNARREIDPKPFAYIVDAYKKMFGYLSPFIKQQMLLTTLLQADKVMALGDSRNAASLYSLSKTLLGVSNEPFRKKNYILAKISLQQAYIYKDTGQFEPAVRLLSEGLKEIDLIEDPSDRSEMMGFYYRYLAQIRLAEGKTQDAITNYRQSIEAFTKIKHINAIGGWGELAQVYAAEGKNEEALSAVRSGFASRSGLKDLYPSNALDQEEASLHVANVQSFYALKDYANLRQAIKKGEAASKNPRVAATLYIYNGFLDIEEKNDYPQALNKFNKALEIVSNTEQSPLTELINLHLGKCHSSLGRPKEALPFLEKALVINRNLRKASRGSLAYANVEARSTFEEIQQEIRKVLYDLITSEDNSSQSLKQKLLYYAEQSKSRRIVDEMESFRGMGGLTVFNPTISEEDLKIVKDLIAPLDIQSYPTIGSLNVKIPNLFNDYRRFVSSLTARHGVKAVIMEFVPIELRDKVVLYVIDENNVNVTTLNDPWSKIQDNVQRYRNLLKLCLKKYSLLDNSPSPDVNIIQQIKRIEKEIEASSKEIGASLFPDLYSDRRGIARYINGRSLIIVPHGILHNLPFPSVKLSDQRGQKRYLIDLVRRFASAPSLTVLRYLKTKYKTNLTQKITSVLLVGETDNPSLPAVSAEFKDISKIYRRTPIISEKVPLKGMVQNSSAVHFGTHAYFDRSNPGTSGLNLKDGVLTFSEIVRFEAMRTRLVTMGACETGEAGILTGDEVLSLSTGFMVAGIPAVVGSLWEQEGETSHIFFSSFYRYLAMGKGVGSAFHASMLHVRQGNNRASKKEYLGLMNYSNPCYWSGFHFIGE